MTQLMDNNFKDWLDPEKTQKFKTLINIMAKNMGGLMKAYNFIGTNGNIQEELRTGISVDTAKKILKAYKKYKGLAK